MKILQKVFLHKKALGVLFPFAFSWAGRNIELI